MAVKKTTIVKKKYWYQILAPKLLGGEVIGEALGSAPEEMVGRTVNVNLATITNEPQTQHITLKFRITGTANNNLETALIEYKIMPSALKKLMRKEREKIEDSFSAKTADGKDLRIKTVMITRHKAQNSVLAALQKQGRAFVNKTLAKLSYDDFLQQLARHAFQKAMSQELRKTYPLAYSEVKWMILQEKTKATQAQETVKEVSQTKPVTSEAPQTKPTETSAKASEEKKEAVAV